MMQTTKETLPKPKETRDLIIGSITACTSWVLFAKPFQYNWTDAYLATKLSQINGSSFSLQLDQILMQLVKQMVKAGKEYFRP
jgi:hypothetical protein